MADLTMRLNGPLVSSGLQTWASNKQRWVELHISGDDNESWVFQVVDAAGKVWAYMTLTAMPDKRFDIGHVKVLGKDGPDSRFGRDLYQTVIDTAQKVGAPLRSLRETRSLDAEYAQHRLRVVRGVEWTVPMGVGPVQLDSGLAGSDSRGSVGGHLDEDVGAATGAGGPGLIAEG